MNKNEKKFLTILLTSLLILHSIPIANSYAKENIVIPDSFTYYDNGSYVAKLIYNSSYGCIL